MNFNSIVILKRFFLIILPFLIANYSYAQQFEKEEDDSDMINHLARTTNKLSSNTSLDAGKHKDAIKNLSDNIISEEIVNFRYSTVALSFSLELSKDRNIKPKTYKDFGIEQGILTFSVKAENNGRYLVEASGTNQATKRDGKTFTLKYYLQNSNFVNELQRIVKKYSLSKNNGRINRVDGLPTGDGDILSIKYVSGESIYKQDNQGMVINLEATADIYNAFKNNALQHGYDFTTEKSNITVYNDPDEDMLQGTWKGTHFGHDCVIVISGKHIKIYYNGMLTDDTDYVIDEGAILTNKTDGTRHLPFTGITSLSKINSFTLSGYVYKNKSSSSFNLLKQEPK